MQREINPKKTKWKYFSLNDKGDIVCFDERSDGKPVMAIINTSMFFRKRGDAPVAMRDAICKFFNKEAKAKGFDLILAVPCSSLEEMQEYYGKQNFYDKDGKEIDPNYVQLRMHNDLRKGDINFIYDGFGETSFGTMPIKEGAEQIASAIENGFNIWSCFGGMTIAPKLWLCEEYFARHAPELRDKVYFVGFSDVSNVQLYLRGLITPIHYLGFLSVANSREFFDLVFRASCGEIGVTNTRTLACDDVSVVKERCAKLLKEGDVITNITCFPYNIGSLCNSRFPAFQGKEKVILGLEGFFQDRSGRNMHEILFKSLESGFIDPEKILFVLIEDLIMDKEVFKIARQSGLIPKELDKAKSDYVKSLASEFGVDEKKYIEYLHAATKAEIERVKEVAQKYNIPVVLHKGRGAGHGADPAIQFSRVCDLEFYEDRREIVQTSILQKEPVGQDLFCEIRGEGVPVLDWSGLELSAKLGKGEVFLGREEERQVLDYSKSTKGLISDDEDEAKQEVKNAELRLLNNNKDLNESEHEDVISGSALNIVEVNVGDVAKKGVAIYLNNCGSFNSELYQIIESPQLRNARFIILAMAIPESVQDKDEYLQCRYNFYSKLFSDLGIEKPCFITESSVNESKMAPLFSADVNLKDMLLKNGTKKAASRIVKSAISSALQEAMHEIER